MKVETIITAIAFFTAGFLGGFVYKSHRDSTAQIQVQATETSTAASAETAAMPGSSAARMDASTQLPKGHPPLEAAEIIKSYEDRAAQNPQDPQIPLRLANYLYDNQYYDLAIEWYQKALALDPNNVNARTDLGTAYFYSGDPREAIQQYNKALAASPNHEPTIFNLIVVNLEGTHDLRAAEKFWNQLHQRNPNYAGLNDLKEKLDAASGNVKTDSTLR